MFLVYMYISVMRMEVANFGELDYFMKLMYYSMYYPFLQIVISG